MNQFSCFTYYIIVDSKDRTLDSAGHWYGELSGDAGSWRAHHYGSLDTAIVASKDFAEKTGESYLVMCTFKRVVVQRTLVTQGFT